MLRLVFSQDLEPRDFHQGGDCSILYSVYVVVKVIAQRTPTCPGIAHVRYTKAHVRRGRTFVYISAVSGKLGSRGEGRSSLAIFNRANAIYRHSAVAVVVVFGSYVSDES